RGVVRRTQEPARPERGHRAWKRGPDRAVRRSGARASQLCHRPVSDESGILAWRGRHDDDRGLDRGAGDQCGPVGVVRRSADPHRVRHFRHDALPVATPDLVTVCGTGRADSLVENIMLRQFLFGGGVSAINIAIHALMTTILVRLAQTASAKKRAHPAMFLAAVMIPTVLLLMV